MFQNRWSIAASVVALILAMWLLVTWLPRVTVQRDIAAARETAVGVVAAIAGNDLPELEYRLGRVPDADEMRRLGDAVPSQLPSDPRDYSGTFYNPTGDGGATVEVHSQSDADFAVLVRMTPDKDAGGWRVLSVEAVSPK
ncbi:MAG: hypothetical protein LLG08_09690 [Actinomycetia bacterium]|nr:hypothetical protein [Actinomycetes bacterium]